MFRINLATRYFLIKGGDKYLKKRKWKTSLCLIGMLVLKTRQIIMIMNITNQNGGKLIRTKKVDKAIHLK